MRRTAKSRARLGAWLCAAAALVAAPRTAAAQTSPEHAIEDAGVFRGALATVWANARVTIGDEFEDIRFTRHEAGLVVSQPETATWVADDDALPLPLRLVAAMYGTGELDDAVAALGFRLVPRVVGIEPFDDVTLVVRIGDDAVSVAVEPGISRPRELRMAIDGVTWTARATEYSDRANGWLPTRVVVARDDVTVVDFVVTDLARVAEDLPPASMPGTRPDAGVRFPRMPL